MFEVLKMRGVVIFAWLLCVANFLRAAEAPAADPSRQAIGEAVRISTGRIIGPFPLYEGEIPNSKPCKDNERHRSLQDMEIVSGVTRPTYTVYLPPASRASRAAVLIFPGGGYVDLSWDLEGRWIASALQDHGILGVLVKYRLPSERCMQDPALAPLQDAQQALREVRHHAKEWGIDPKEVGAMGFSAGGHLASMLGTSYDTATVPNPDSVNLRPDALILVYPVVSFTDARVNSLNRPTRNALLGEHPTEALVRRFSSELHVTDRTPPTLLLAASNDSAIDYEHSISFYRALRAHRVPAELVLFDRGQHRFFELTREEWQAPLWDWLKRNGWVRR